MLFSARTFVVLLYCIFLSWHSNWFTHQTGSLGDDITSQELSLLIQADAKHDLFRTPEDLVTFLSEPGQYSQPFHLLLLFRLKTAAFYEDKVGIRHILTRQDLAVSLAKHFLPTLLTDVAAYPLFMGDLAPYTLLQTHAYRQIELPHSTTSTTSGDNNDDDDGDGDDNNNIIYRKGESFGYNSAVVMRFRSRRDFVDWLLGVCRDLESGQLQRELDYPLRAYRSLLGSRLGLYDDSDNDSDIDDGDNENIEDSAGDGSASQSDAKNEVVMMAVPLSGATSALLERVVVVLLPVCLLGVYYILLTCIKCVFN